MNEVIVPEEHPLAKGFYFFPENRNILVSRTGEFKDARRIHKNRTAYKHQISGYYFITYDGKTYRRNRIIAKTFIGRPERHLDKPYSALEVNHIDHDRTNDSIDNLEWVTGSENSKHCRLAFRHKQDFPCLVKNLYTGLITKYNSISFAAECHYIYRVTLWKIIRNGKNLKCHKDGFMFKLDDGSDWPEINISDIPSLRNITDKDELKLEIAVTDKDAEEKVIFKDIYSAAEYTGISPKVIVRHLTSKLEFDTDSFHFLRLTPIHIRDNEKAIIVRDLVAKGLNNCEIKRETGISREFIRKVKRFSQG